MKLLVNVLAFASLALSSSLLADGWECESPDKEWTVLFYDRVSTNDTRVPAHLVAYQKDVRSLSASNPRSTRTDEIKFEGITTDNKPENWPQGWTKPGSQYTVAGDNVENKGRGTLKSLELRVNGNPFSSDDEIVYEQVRKGQLILTYATTTTEVDLNCSRYTTAGRREDN